MEPLKSMIQNSCVEDYIALFEEFEENNDLYSAWKESDV